MTNTKPDNTYRVVKGVNFGADRHEPGALLAESDLPKGQKTWLLSVGAIEQAGNDPVDLDQPAKDVISAVGDVEYLSELEQLREAETAGAARKTVLEAIDKAIDDLTPTDDQES